VGASPAALGSEPTLAPTATGAPGGAPTLARAATGAGAPDLGGGPAFAPAGGRGEPVAAVTRAARRALGRAAAAPVPEPEAEGPVRPQLSLVPTPAPEASPPPPAPRQLARSAVDRLADLTGGEVEGGEGGLRTVHFPAPGAPAVDLTQAPYTVTRLIGDHRRQARPATAPAPATTQPDTAVPPSAPPQAPAPAAEAPKDQPEMDLEAAYEYFLDRFKRDLIVEREQSGHLLIDNP
jgi:hypothetical protein